LITWLLPFLGPIPAIILLVIFGPYLLNLVVKFVSSHLEKLKFQMLMEMKSTYYHRPEDGPLRGQS
jgi:hypothetical protein